MADENTPPEQHSNETVDGVSSVSRAVEYEVQAYGFSFKAVTDELFRAFDGHLYDVSVQFERRLQQAGEIEERELETKMKRFREKMRDEIGQIADDSGVYLQSRYSVPADTVLVEDEIHLRAPLSDLERERMHKAARQFQCILAKEFYKKRTLELMLEDMKKIVHDER